MAPVESINNTSAEEQRLDALLLKTPIVDTHNDFPYLLRVQLHNEITTGNQFNFNGQLTSHTSLQKFKKGKLGVQFFSCYIECKSDDYLYQDFNMVNSAVRDTIEQIDVVKRLVDEYPGHMKFVTNSKDAMDNYLSGDSISVTMGVEGLHQVDTSLGVLRRYYELGVRYITLTHNCDNPFATAASSITGGLPDKGLSDYGRDCIKEMNRLGLICDLSHVSYKTMLDTLEVTKSPVMFSHSSVYALTAHERNVRDDVLVKLKENDGVICINFFPLFISQDGSGNATIDDAVDHILHAVKLAGWDHVGFGSDFDGIPEGPKGLEDVSKYPELIYKVMQRSGATDEQISGLIGGNVMRVWAKNEEIAEQLKEEKVVESNWEGRVWEFYKYVDRFPEIYPGSRNARKNKLTDKQPLIMTQTQEAEEKKK